MDSENPSAKDLLLYGFLFVFGCFLVLSSFLLRSKSSNWADLSLNVGATLISTAILTFIYLKLGSKDLLHQISEMRHSLSIAQHSLEFGVRNMWRVRKDIPNSMWNDFTATAQSKVWLLGVAEQGFANDEVFQKIVAAGTARGCCYRFLLLDPNSDAATEIDRKEGGGRQVQGRINQAIHKFQEMQQINAEKRGSIEIAIYADVPRVSIVRSEDELLVTPYMPPLVGNMCFTLHVQKTTNGVFAQYIQHFETLWNDAKMLPPLPPTTH